MSRRRNGEGSIYPVPGGYRGYVWCIGPDGTRYRKYVKGKTYDEARQAWLKLQDEAKAWGLIPVEFTTDLRWQVLKDLWLKADLWAFEGAAYRSPDGSAHYGNGGFDLDGGVEFRITRMLNLWFQMNNILNDKYQRWHQYPVYGFNFLGGIIFSFNTK